MWRCDQSPVFVFKRDPVGAPWVAFLSSFAESKKLGDDRLTITSGWELVAKLGNLLGSSQAPCPQMSPKDQTQWRPSSCGTLPRARLCNVVVRSRLRRLRRPLDPPNLQQALERSWSGKAPLHAGEFFVTARHPLATPLCAKGLLGNIPSLLFRSLVHLCLKPTCVAVLISREPHHYCCCSCGVLLPVCGKSCSL